jgi:ABC-type nitrate/sulfonate/bicarbonate transport system ATPase subunit/ABC-type transporter Mla maintaining outer membrane lipid asymmetry permease subunit MlaE
MPNQALVTVRATRSGPKCPFGNDTIEFSLFPGGCVQLCGNSGLGKTTIALAVADLSSTTAHLDCTVECCWDPSIPKSEQCGVLFQQTTLLDELTVAGNLVVALHKERFATFKDRDLKIKQLLDTVGLDYARDANKRPTELSGGMGRRVSLALQLAQNKRVIVLDEPFTGLDRDAAILVAKELVHLRERGMSLLLITHEPDIAAVVMDADRTKHNQLITLQPPNKKVENDCRLDTAKPCLFGASLLDRFLDKLRDYVILSLPLIVLAFIACGLSIAMLSADLLQRLDVTDKVIDIVDTEVRPLIKMLTGEEPGVLTMMGVKFKVRSMIDTAMPEAKATIYARGMVQLFVLEIGPLLTALLLAGRIGGSYAGKVATMQATSQNKLLTTLSVNPVTWSLVPSMSAAYIAGPLLTMIGTAIALLCGCLVGPRYGIGNTEFYLKDMRQTMFPVLRLKSMLDTTSKTDGKLTMYLDAMVELFTWPPIYHLVKAMAFIWIIMAVAESCARYRPNLTPRGVPAVITSSVVIGGLLVILADWGFSQLWLLRR